MNVANETTSTFENRINQSALCGYVQEGICEGSECQVRRRLTSGWTPHSAHPWV
ncbi:hypothetical protein CANTEDRAFT_113581 [Yamadazyma tenuis ATCC 10573]|uniref:Uncharacterized protein n=1 Tax=Candida tenuis (strain ATCC 10573 / BCRC 21748 / CBS 615 / JCM 9827 / NBRC 10315 / NRRL Y-1498 / VKM Y-70) TaxID=590646 RepID=G3B0V1_CANTC|nr:uncharacterized protein CANTEDRAFT_113581 [Yamadazyma tenuis ATCC 10573]EGV64810.1 hypothetical protein CANTEDRAFT_113581 [Yamadazyma tenuis ATCC 10573]